MTGQVSLNAGSTQTSVQFKLVILKTFRDWDRILKLPWKSTILRTGQNYFKGCCTLRTCMKNDQTANIKALKTRQNPIRACLSQVGKNAPRPTRPAKITFFVACSPVYHPDRVHFPCTNPCLCRPVPHRDVPPPHPPA